MRAGTPADVLHRRAASALLVVEQTGPRRDQPVEARAVAVPAVPSVPGDRASDHPGIDLRHGRVIDTETLRRARSKALDDDVRAGSERSKCSATVVGAQVETGAPLPPLPDAVSRLRRERIAVGRFDPGDLRAVVGEQHRRHRARGTPRQVEHPEPLEHAGHSSPPQSRLSPPNLAVTMARSHSDHRALSRAGLLSTGCRRRSVVPPARRAAR